MPEPRRFQESQEPALRARREPHQARLGWAQAMPAFWPSWLGLGLLFLLHQLPRRWLRPIVAGVARLLEKGSGRNRLVAARNIQRCFPDATQSEQDALLRRYFQSVARCGIDYGLLWFGSARKHARHLVVVGEEHFQRLRAQGTPVIVLAPHSVALDHGGLRMSQLHAAVAFAKPMRNPVAEWLNHRSRTRYSATVYTRDQGLRPVLRAMHAGRFFYYLPDEDLGPTGAVFADFFAARKATLTALGRLARVAGARVLPSFSYYDADRDRYVLRLWPPLEGFPTGDAVADAETMNRALERAIRVAPEQYFWAMKMFRTRPAGEPDPYREDCPQTGPIQAEPEAPDSRSVMGTRGDACDHEGGKANRVTPVPEVSRVPLPSDTPSTPVSER